MAPFTATVPQANSDMPDWLNRPKPVSQPEADKSKGIMLSTIGEGIEGTAKIAENTFEDWMKDHVRAGVESIRDTNIAAFEDIRKGQETGQPVDANAANLAGFKGTLAQNDGKGIPANLSTGLDKASQLGLAKAQGKANDTLYTGAIYSLAKQLRAQFPGH